MVILCNKFKEHYILQRIYAYNNIILCRNEWRIKKYTRYYLSLFVLCIIYITYNNMYRKCHVGLGFERKVNNIVVMIYTRILYLYENM